MVNFWTDKWLSKSLVEILEISSDCSRNLKAKVKDFVHNGKIYIPQVILDRNPSLAAEVVSIVVPSVPISDEMVWSSTSSGNLSLKEAHNLLYSNSVVVP